MVITTGTCINIESRNGPSENSAGSPRKFTRAIRRRPLEGLWEAELAQVVEPSPIDHVEGQIRSTFEGGVNRAGIVTNVEVRYLSDESGFEFLFRPQQERSALQDRFPAPSPGILSEIRLLAPVVPGKIIAIGLNYKSHLGDIEPPKVPEPFIKTTSSVIGPVFGAP